MKYWAKNYLTAAAVLAVVVLLQLANNDFVGQTTWGFLIQVVFGGAMEELGRKLLHRTNGKDGAMAFSSILGVVEGVGNSFGLGLAGAAVIFSFKVIQHQVLGRIMVERGLKYSFPLHVGQNAASMTLMVGGAMGVEALGGFIWIIGLMYTGALIFLNRNEWYPGKELVA